MDSGVPKLSDELVLEVEQVEATSPYFSVSGEFEVQPHEEWLYFGQLHNRLCVTECKETVSRMDFSRLVGAGTPNEPIRDSHEHSSRANCSRHPTKLKRCTHSCKMQVGRSGSGSYQAHFVDCAEQ